MKPATLLETWKTLLTVLLEHDKFREEHFQQCLVSFGIHFTLQRENALFILNPSAIILYDSNRYTPNQDTYIDEVLNESVYCS